MGPLRDGIRRRLPPHIRRCVMCDRRYEVVLVPFAQRLLCDLYEIVLLDSSLRALAHFGEEGLDVLDLHLVDVQVFLTLCFGDVWLEVHSLDRECDDCRVLLDAELSLDEPLKVQDEVRGEVGYVVLFLLPPPLPSYHINDSVAVELLHQVREILLGYDESPLAVVLEEGLLGDVHSELEERYGNGCLLDLDVVIRTALGFRRRPVTED
mmetsp:Transcript_6910/g.13873  ORF Transcript_6910/g.13873 Transcript_6910/m.13873 type:complete len:209 (-) Transcript_6910:198-824(-)